MVVLITAEKENSTFRLFETLNDRGLELSAIDLMKNYFLKTVTNTGKNTDSIKNKWENIILNIQPLSLKVRFFYRNIDEANISEDSFSKNEKIIINEHLDNLNSIWTSPSRTLLLGAFTETSLNNISASDLLLLKFGHYKIKHQE